MTSTSRGKQRELFLDKLLEMPLVRAYCNRVPSGEFEPTEVMEQVSGEYSMGWSEKTIQTKARRISLWLSFIELVYEREDVALETTEKMPRDDLSDP